MYAGRMLREGEVVVRHELRHTTRSGGRTVAWRWSTGTSAVRVTRYLTTWRTCVTHRAPASLRYEW